MNILILLLILICTFNRPAYSYPESQIDDCITSALSNPATKSISKSSIKNYCDCALKLIIDEKKDIRNSGYECAMKNFN
tara:strand:+ start:2284 stop:2520 length:237 start_codon:yes stop_codon:yes gene_type:complete